MNNVASQIEDPVTEDRPVEWTSDQQLIAGEALDKLSRYYPGWRWGVAFTEVTNLIDKSWALMLKLLDVPTDLCYIIQHKDIDRGRMTCIMKGGGEFLEALGLPRSKWRHDELRNLKRTPGGLILPYHDAFPDCNPGRAKAKENYDKAYYPKPKKVN